MYTCRPDGITVSANAPIRFRVKRPDRRESDLAEPLPDPSPKHRARVECPPLRSPGHDRPRAPGRATSSTCRHERESVGTDRVGRGRDAQPTVIVLAALRSPWRSSQAGTKCHRRHFVCLRLALRALVSRNCRCTAPDGSSWFRCRQRARAALRDYAKSRDISFGSHGHCRRGGVVGRAAIDEARDAERTCRGRNPSPLAYQDGWVRRNQRASRERCFRF